MSAPARRWQWVGLLLLGTVAWCTGCNLLALPYFLLDTDANHPAKCKLASEDHEKEVRIVILTFAGLETRPEFLRVDRELSSALAKQLKESFTANKEKVVIASTVQIEKYKDEHPNWHAMDLEEIGKHFRADYVIDLEIDSLTLYEPGSRNTLYRGHAEISISVVDVHKPGEEPIYKEEYSCEYPKTRGPIPAGDTNPQQFRQQFLGHVAKQLSWRFTAHPTEDDFSCD
jgi:hypothetical protein